MNAKKAKLLRQAAGYRNQTATPGTMPFPGIARFYQRPVFHMRTAIKTCYMRLPMSETWTKVETKLRHLVHDHRDKPVQDVTMMLDTEKKSPTFGQQVPKYVLDPVSMPGRLNHTEPKGVYRHLKKLARKNLLGLLGGAILQANMSTEGGAV